MEILKREYILLDVEAQNKYEILFKMARAIENGGSIIDIEKYLLDVTERENISSTAVGFNVAIPHGKSEVVKTPAICFARLKKEIDWDEEETVKYIFLLAVPEEKSNNLHLELLVKLSRKILTDDFRNIIENATSVEEIKNIVEN